MIHEQAAGFVLGALDSAEADEFERHLTVCPDCDEELERLRLAAAALAFAGELPPPRAELRRRVVVSRLSHRWPMPAASVLALAACAAVAVGLSGTPPRRQVSFQLPPAPAGKVYEIWFVRHGHASPAGFAHAGRNELAHVPRSAAVAVTLEPRGGSRRPTGPLLLRAETA